MDSSAELLAEIDSTSIAEYLKTKLSDAPMRIEHRPLLPQVIQELRDYGITTLAELDKIVTKSFLQVVAKHKPVVTDVGLLRNAMMVHDLDRYIERSWKKHFNGLIPSTQRLLSEKYGSDKVKEAVRRMTTIRKAITTKRRPVVRRDAGKPRSLRRAERPWANEFVDKPLFKLVRR